MISKSTIQKIYDEARIEEVVGDFVNLRKRGSNLTGLCPFHNEKTPSFAVSPSRNIYKCFGCGKGGDSVNFIMEHEHYTYPEALRFIARKYHIEIEETIPTPEEKQAEDERENLYVANAYAQKYFTTQLNETEEGKAIGRSYFVERGFTTETIDKFQLGYSPSQRDAFTKEALASQFKIEVLEKAGLSIVKENNYYDRFWGRVMFPIHNLTGRVIGFGARILKTDAHVAKYLNSPETDIYTKSKILYGIFFAKKSIVQNDECYLCEGYTDVISMHQSGIENAVASSGTSLTPDQIKLIKRYTNNITVLYDGDPAGIKASLRGIDMILEEGMNVRVVLFPDGDDPDSYSKKVSSSEFRDFLKKNAKDFIVFKTSLLLSDVANDPIGKSKLIREIVETIAKVPDAITRSTYTKHCSTLLDVDESILISEINKLRRNEFKKKYEEPESTDAAPLDVAPAEQPAADEGSYHQEKEIIRLLLSYADAEITASAVDQDTNEEKDVTVKVKQFMKQELEYDGIRFENELFAEIFAAYDDTAEDNSVELTYFLHHENVALRNLAAELVSSKYELSQHWGERGIIVMPFDQQLQYGVKSSVYRLKEKFIRKISHDLIDELKNSDYSDEEKTEAILNKKKQLDELYRLINKFFGTVISS